MVFAILASTFLSNIPIKALTTKVSGDDIIAQAQSYENWGYLQVGTCTGLVTRVLNDLGIGSSIVGTMQGNIAQYSPEDMYDNALAHSEQAEFIWDCTRWILQRFTKTKCRRLNKTRPSRICDWWH